MNLLALHETHRSLGACFTEVAGEEVAAHYGETQEEGRALRETAGLLDLSFRGRLCLLGADRQRFLNGQVTNDVRVLKPGQGCYAALITAKGKMQSDLHIHLLAEEILLDFEPGLSAAIAERLEKFVIADDVQIVDVAPHYGLLSVQGPRSRDLLEKLNPGAPLPASRCQHVQWSDPSLGEVYVMNLPRTGGEGFDLFVPNASLSTCWDKLLTAAKLAGGCACGWEALEAARIEAGIPRFGVDMDETNLAPEPGIAPVAISYSKGCYIGQEVINRIRTYGQVTKSLRGLRLAGDLPALPVQGDKLFKDGKEVGYITSALASEKLEAKIALGYVRRESNEIGTELTLQSGGGTSTAKIVALPFL